MLQTPIGARRHTSLRLEQGGLASELVVRVAKELGEHWTRAIEESGVPSRTARHHHARAAMQPPAPPRDVSLTACVVLPDSVEVTFAPRNLRMLPNSSALGPSQSSKR